MCNCLRFMRGLLVLLAVLCTQLSFGQGFVDLTSESETTKWLPDGSLSHTFSNLGTPPVTVTANIQGSTNRFNNNTPRSDSRGLWLSINLGSRTQVVTISFTFSDPVTNLSFALLGIDRELSFSNYQDRVAIEAYDDKNVGILPTITYNPNTAYLSNGTAPHIKVLSGFNTDALDTTRATVNFRNSGVKRFTLTYGSGSEARNGALSTQSIFLSSLSWSNIVPVQLMYFRGKAEAERVRLSWATALEINSSHFNVERSTDLKEFSTIGKLTSAGDSRQLINYSFLDEAPLPGVNYYRLKQVDKDGTSDYSKIIAVSPQAEATQFVIYPNPSDGNSVRLQFDNLELDRLRLITMLGQEIPFDIQATSNNSLTIRPHKILENGLYFMTYQTPDRGRVSQKLWVTR
ncbi:MAG TPA: hypothetical protein DCM71_22850 [Runella sp.]|nr:hypothetical protein [Runella sp.]